MRRLMLMLVLILPLPQATLALQDATLIAPPSDDQLERSMVIRVVDGDTVHVDLNGVDETIRLIGVDTPETVDPRGPVACFGQEASSFTKEVLAPGTEVWLEIDVSDTDRYQRLLRYIWVKYDSDDGRFDGLIGLDDVANGDLVLFNQLLVNQGYAASSAYPPDIAYQETFVEDQAAAREEGRGLWGACSAFGVLAESESPVDVVPTSEAIVSASGGECDASYPGSCVPLISVSGDLDCRDVPERQFEVLPPDPHGFDGNGDGVGCES